MNVAPPSPLLPLWGGLECTINRIGDRWFDQVARTGHATRLDDLDRIAELGIRTLRYPVLWERTAPESLSAAGWEWSRERLERLRELEIRPIAGLVHHGSGPAGTSLLDPAWPERFAAYAEAVARQYPWLDAYTPVNEPLTTARFSGLYGHWYPHRRDDRAFAAALIAQVKGVVLAMQRIRSINPAAVLVQTEDLTHVRATERLGYQAAFENERRWVTLDLLTGSLTPGMVMHDWLRGAGIAASDLAWFREHAVAPDLIGWNYYVLSERYLEEDAECRTGNGRHTYHDRDAARTVGLTGLGPLLHQAHDRFSLPMAVTEIHLSGPPDEQLRWLVESWDAACAARRAGVDLRGFTVWSLLGAYDWDSLCMQERGWYEPGVFDVRSGTPVPTALAEAVRQLVRGERPVDPALATRGWWHPC